MTGAEATAIDGVRLLSHRPSVLYKVEHLATEPVEGDIAVDGLVVARPGSASERLKDLLKAVSASERACLFALRLNDEQGLPLPAETLLDRARTDWFPDFLSHGQMKPHFQPIVELATGRAYGRARRSCAASSAPSRSAAASCGRGRGPRRAVLVRLPGPAPRRSRSAFRCCPKARCCSSTSTRAPLWTSSRRCARPGRS